MIVRTGFIPPLLTCTDPSAMKKLGKSQTRAHLSVTDCFGSLPIRHDPLWCCPPWCQPLRMTESKDEGRTWGVTKPDGMDQPAARCQVRTLASGNWIFVKHLSPPDSYNDNKRIGQVAYLSRDEGKTWEGGLVLDARKSVTYPDVEQGPDGLIYVTHDFERGREAEIILHRFTEEDILAKRFQSPKSRQGIVVTKAMGTKHNQKKYGNK